MTIKACVFVGVEPAVVRDQVILPAVPATGGVLHVVDSEGMQLRLVVRRVEMIGRSASERGPGPPVRIYCDDPALVFSSCA